MFQNKWSVDQNFEPKHCIEFVGIFDFSITVDIFDKILQILQNLFIFPINFQFLTIKNCRSEI